jgi:cytochrome bd ubiquinol oxidase subunit I
MYHFLFVPLTLGLSFLLVIMEAIYVMTGKPIYKDMVKFWGKLFGINFALGVTTGITMEFQFGTNWAYYSHYVGDIFGAPLAIEGLMAFFLESTFIGLFFFGWDRLSKMQHLMVTVLMAVGSNLSALWILIANGWMQDPVGAEFHYHHAHGTDRLLGEVMFNPTRRPSSCTPCRPATSPPRCSCWAFPAWYLLKGRDVEFARARSASPRLRLRLGAVGDRAGRRIRLHRGESQKSKLAAIEAMWETEPAPAGFNLLAWPNEEKQAQRLGGEDSLRAGPDRHALDQREMPGIKEIKANNRRASRTASTPC